MSTTRLVHKLRLCIALNPAKPYSTKPFEEIPCAKGLPLVGNLFSLIAAGGATKLHEYVNGRHREFGIIFKETLANQTVVFLNDVDEIKKVFANGGKYPRHVLPEGWLLYNKLTHFKRGLYFMDGEEWHHYRKILNTVMLRDDFNQKASKNEGIIERCYDSWLSNAENGKVVDLETQLYNLSLIFMTSFILGSSFHQNVDAFLPTIHKLSPFLREIFEWSVQLSIVPAKVAKYLRLKSWTGFVNTIDNSVKLSSDLLNEMLKYKSDSILGYLMEKEVPREMISRIIIDFFIAAGDTTATATTWILYLLGRNKHIQHQLFKELQTNPQFWEIPLLKRIIKESLRLYPVAPFIARYLGQTTEIASYSISPETLISMSMLNCSRNENYFPDANAFKPDRWERLENGKYAQVLDPTATLPYATGTRSCIGRKLAEAQLCCTVSKLVATHELDVPKAVDIKLNLITVPSEPITLIIRKRK